MENISKWHLPKKRILSFQLFREKTLEFLMKNLTVINGVFIVFRRKTKLNNFYKPRCLVFKKHIQLILVTSTKPRPSSGKTIKANKTQKYNKFGKILKKWYKTKFLCKVAYLKIQRSSWNFRYK